MILHFKAVMIHWFIIWKSFHDTSLINILFHWSRFSGPIASYFTNRYGCRLVTIAGTVLAAIGMALSTLASSIMVLYLTVGVLTGLGFGLIYLPAIVSVSIYFEKKRAFATGIAVCGSGLGTFILSPFTKWWAFLFHWAFHKIYFLKGCWLSSVGKDLFWFCLSSSWQSSSLAAWWGPWPARRPLTRRWDSALHIKP